MPSLSRSPHAPFTVPASQVRLPGQPAPKASVEGGLAEGVTATVMDVGSELFDLMDCQQTSLGWVS